MSEPKPSPWKVERSGGEIFVVGPNGECLVARGIGDADSEFLAEWTCHALNNACANPESQNQRPPSLLRAPIAGYHVVEITPDPPAPEISVDTSGLSGMPAPAEVTEMSELEDARGEF